MDCILPRNQRLSKIKDTYRFSCACPRCDAESSDGDDNTLSDFLKSDIGGDCDPLTLRRFMSAASDRDSNTSSSVDGIITRIIADEVTKISLLLNIIQMRLKANTLG